MAESVAVRRGELVAVAGPSGVGKSTIVRRAVELRPTLWLSVSATTRKPRPGEVAGVDYEFLSEVDFADLRTQGGFLESAEFADNCYGTPRKPVIDRLAAGTTVLLEIDVQGVRQVRASEPSCSTVFIRAPSMEVLRSRLLARGTEDEASLARRVAAAETEMAAMGEFDTVIVNDDVDQAAQQLLRWTDLLR